jgi:deoxyadenosine/deoxycytidine kinase
MGCPVAIRPTAPKERSGIQEYGLVVAMRKLIAVVGNCGSGKSALTRKLSEHYDLVPLLEQHQERPFQARFQSDLRNYSLANQIDYLLFRAEQELSLRESDKAGIADGGLEQDFHVFTRLFLLKGFLDEQEYRLCERMVQAVRRTLPPPDLMIRLSAPLDILIKRRAARTRKLDIVTTDDLSSIEDIIETWMAGNTIPTILFDTSEDDPDYSLTTRPLLSALDHFFSLP